MLRHIDQRNVVIDNSEINSYIYGQLIFDRVPRPFNKERIVLETKCTETIKYPHVKE